MHLKIYSEEPTTTSDEMEMEGAKEQIKS